MIKRYVVIQFTEYNYNDTITSAGVGINMTEPCQYPVPVGLEKGYIPDVNIWATTQINAIRGARYGRLRGWRGLWNADLLYRERF